MYFPNSSLWIEEPHKSSSFVINSVCASRSLVSVLMSDVSVIMLVFILCLSVVYVLLLSSAAGGDHGVFGLREERISCLRFLLSLCPLHAPLALSGRARPLGRRWAGAAVNHTRWPPQAYLTFNPWFTDKPIVLDYNINLTVSTKRNLHWLIWKYMCFVLSRDAPQ